MEGMAQAGNKVQSQGGSMNNPCVECELKYDHGGHKGCDRRPNDGDVYKTEDTDPICEPFAFYEGYQEGLAQAESKVKAREREIVEWIRNQCDPDSKYDWQFGPDDMARWLESWLQGKE